MIEPSSEFGFGDKPNKGRLSRWLWVLVCLAVLLLWLLSPNIGSFFKHWLGETDLLASHTDDDCERYDRQHASTIIVPDKNGRNSIACQYDSVTLELVGCGLCKERDRQALLAEARLLKEHGAGWKRADISYSTTICPVNETRSS